MAKTRQQKQQLFSLYQDILESKDFVLIQLHEKLPTQAINAFRMYLLDNGGKMYLLKNKIFMKAAEELNKPTLPQIELQGQVALVTASDVIVALKGLEAFEKHAKDLLALSVDDEEFVKKYRAYDYLFGVIQGTRVEAADLQMLSTLPGVEALYGMLAGGLKALLSGLVGVLGGNIRNLAYALKQIAENKA